MRGSPSQNRDPRRRESRRGALPMLMLPSCNSFQPVSRVCSPSSWLVPVSSIFLLAQVCFFSRWSSVLGMTKPRKTYFIKYDFLGFFFLISFPWSEATSRAAPVAPALWFPRARGSARCAVPGLCGNLRAGIKWEVACSRPHRRRSVCGTLQTSPASI